MPRHTIRHWLRQLFHPKKTLPIRKARPTTRRRDSLGLEGLEDRTVPAIFIVTNTDDSGAGSFRDALVQANALTGADTIQFAIPGAGVHSIAPTVTLPPISESVMIDGTTQPGYAGSPLIELRGDAPGTTALDGLTLSVASSTIRGLIINRFTRDGISITGTASGNVITGNWIGTDATGLVAAPNGTGPGGGEGIAIASTSNGNTIGGLTSSPGTGLGNIISGNTNGIRLDGTGNTIAGNLIGLGADGTTVVANASTGIFGGGNNNTVGGLNSQARNVISGNFAGFYLGTGDGWQILNNFVGTDRTGTLARGNSANYFYGPTNLTFGAAGAGNVWSGNGTTLYGFGSNWTIQGNRFGTTADGTAPLSNVLPLQLFSASNLVFGGTGAGAGNQFDTSIDLQNVNGGSFQGNTFGLTADGTAALTDSKASVRLYRSGNFTIGGPTTQARNVFAGQEIYSLQITGFGADNNTVRGNYFGTNTAGTAQIGSNLYSILVQNEATGTTIDGNVIAQAGVAGIRVDGDSNTSSLAPDGSVAWFPANGSYDNLTGSQTPGTPVNAVSFASGAGSALAFRFTRTSPGYIQSEHTSYTLGGNSVSVEGWVNLASLPALGEEYVIAENGDADDPNSMAFVTNVGGTTRLALRYKTTTGQETILSSPVSLDTSTYHHVAITSDGTNVRFYLDGALIDLQPFVGTATTTYIPVPGDPSIRLYIGGGIGATNRTFDGALDEIGVYGRALTADEIARIYSIGGADKGGNWTHDTTITGNLIGFLADGETAGSMTGNGIEIIGSEGNTIGGSLSAARNVIGNVVGNGSSDTGIGIRLTGQYATDNTIAGNYVGTDATGTLASPNVVGIRLDTAAHHNTIGGITGAARNIISGNTTHGILLSGEGVTSNRVIGNFIGTDKVGFALIPNETGISILNKASFNMIGGAVTEERNVISGNNGDGIRIADSGTTGNVILGNFIGTNAVGTAAIPNGSKGVLLDDGSTATLVGDGTIAGRNIISGNVSRGLQILAASSGNIIQGNYIGTNAAGTAAIPNGTGGASGVRIDGPNNLVGGMNPGEGNLISGNMVRGLVVASATATGNFIQGNYIGTNAAGTAAIPNGTGGVLIGDHSSNTTIGGEAVGAGNLISGNTGEGLTLREETTGNVVQGNFIGTDRTGMSAIPNTLGVELVDASSNTIGGTTIGARNIISGNIGAGVSLVNANVNTIQNNFIGTNAIGTVAIGNGGDGILLADTSRDALVAGNVISGNAVGVTMTGGAAFNRIVGNRIGTDFTGTVDLGNTSHGVQLLTSASLNTIGGPTAAERNVISGNNGDGILINTTSPNGNTVQGNFIGVTVNGTTLANSGNGVEVQSSRLNTIGGSAAGAGNVISGNTGSGVLISGTAATGNVVADNFIGTDVSGNAAIGNGLSGVQVSDSASNNTIGGNDPWRFGAVSTGGNLVTPVGLGIEADGSLVVADQGADLIIRVNPVTGAQTVVSSGLSGQSGLAIAPNGDIYVRATTGIYRIDPVTGAQTLLTSGGNLVFPTGLAVEPGGTLLVADRGASPGTTSSPGPLDGFIVRVDLTTGAQTILASGGFLYNPTGVVVAADGTIYVAESTLDDRNGGIIRIDPVTGAQTLVFDGTGFTTNPVQIALDRTGKLILTDYGFQGRPAVLRIDPATGASEYLYRESAPRQPSGPPDGGLLGVGVAANGDVYFADSNTAAPGVYRLVENSARNIISGNGDNGILIEGSGTTNNTVVGNFIGTNAAGTAGLGNLGSGVRIDNGASNNTIGGTTAGVRNVISGNQKSGVLVYGLSPGGVPNNTLIAGNYIGTNAAGDAAIGNRESGVYLYYAGPSIVGGTTPEARNVISGNLDGSNAGAGVHVATDAGAVIIGNYIGTDATGQTAIGNENSGVIGFNNIRVGTDGDGINDALEGNLISGNGRFGITFGGSNNIAAGNRIGTNATGTAAIAGQTVAGIQISAPAAGASVRFNRIGTNADGVSDDLERNVISGNTGAGVRILSVSGATVSDNTVAGNFIGTDATNTAAIGNDGYGVFVDSPAINTIIGGSLTDTNPALGNVIVNNVAGGIQVNATGTTIRLNEVYDNGGFNVQVATSSAPIAPVLNTVVVNPNGTRIFGTVVGTPNTNYRVDFYDANSSGETRAFLGSVNLLLPASGSLSYDVTLTMQFPSGTTMTAMVTAPNGSTSPISLGSVALPAIEATLSAPSIVSEGVPITVTSQVHSNNPGAILSFAWTAFKNGTPYATSGDASFVFTPDDNGTYAVALTVTDLTNGVVRTFGIPNIQVVNAAPVVDLFDRDTNAAPTPPLSLGNTRRLGTRIIDPGTADTHTYQWLVNGVPVIGATSATFDFTPTTTGIYAVQVQVTDDDGDTGAAITVAYVRSTLPPAGIVGAPAISPEGSPIAVIGKLEGIYSAARLEYQWLVTKNGVAYASATTITTKQQADFAFTPNDNGVYVIALTVRDPATGATSPAPAVTVMVTNVAPVATIRQLSGSPSVGAPVHLTADVTDPGTNATHNDQITYQWRVISLDGTPVSGGTTQDFTFIPPTAGLYIVQVTVADKDGSTFTQSKLIDVAASGRNVQITRISPTDLLEGSAVTLRAAVTDPVPVGTTFTYAWTVLKNGVAFASGSGDTFTFTPDDNARYDVTVSATGSDTASGKATATYTVLNVPPNPTISVASPFGLLEGATVTLTAAANDPGVLDTPQVAWQVSGPGYAAPITGTGRNLSFRLLDDGIYNVAVMVTDKDGGVATVYRTISIANVAPTVTLSGPSSVAANGQVTVGATVSDPGPLDTPSYKWYLNGVLVTTQTGPTFTFTPTAGGDLVTVEVSDPFGAVATSTTLVVAGTTGDDTITVPTAPVGADHILVLGLDGNDTINASGANVPVILDGGSGNDLLIGSSHDDILIAGSGDNVLLGGVGNDILIGGGNDSLDGSTGNDYYKVHFSTVTLTDTSGSDTIDLGDVPFAITLNLNTQGTPQIQNTTSSLTLNGYFESVLGTALNDTLTAAPGTSLYGAGGNDTLSATGGASVLLDGGEGSNQLIVTSVTQPTLYGATGDDFISVTDSPNALIFSSGDQPTLYGAVGDDTITLANSPGSLIQAGAGNDIITITGGSNNTTLYGAAGSDTITVTGGTNLLVVGGEADLLASGDLRPSLYGAAGNDTITLNGGSQNTVFGGDGNDTLLITDSGGSNTLYGAGGNDTLSATGGASVLLDGGGGDNQLNVTSVTQPTLYGADGDDIIAITNSPNTLVQAGAGNNIITLTGGSDPTLYGADGNDTISVTNSPGALVQAGAGNDLLTVAGGSNNTTLYGADGNDQIISTGGTDQVLVGGDGNDTLVLASPESNTLYGAGGDDTLIAGFASPTTLPGVIADTDLVLAAASPDRPTLYGGDGSDTLIDATGSNSVLVGDGGNDTLISLTAHDRGTLYGADGDDTLILPAAGTQVPVTFSGTTINLTAADGVGGTLYGADGNDTLIAASGTSPVLLGGNDNDTLVASGSTRPSLYGGDGDDTLRITTGDSALLVGDAGQDSLIAAGGVNPTLYGADGNDTLTGTGGTEALFLGGADNDTITVSDGIRPTLYGSDGDDTLSVSSPAGTALLVGADGNDTLISTNGGLNTLYGADGNDTLSVGSGDGAVLLGGEGNNTIVVQGGSGHLGLGGSSQDTLIDLSTGGNTTLYGAGGNDTLAAAFAPDDMLVGEDGNDTLISVNADRASLFGSGGDDQIFLGGTFTLPSGTGTITLTGSGGTGGLGYGADGNDTLTATGGTQQVLIGGNGNDTLVANSTLLSTLYGLAGDDTFTVDGGSDAIVLGGDGDDMLTVESGARANLYGEAGNDTLNATGGSELKLFGGSGRDHLNTSVSRAASAAEPGVILIGGSDDDTLTNTGTAATFMWGGTGSDLLIAGGLSNDLLLGEEDDDLYRVSVPGLLVTVTLDEVRKYGATDQPEDQAQLGIDVLDFSAYPSITIDLANINIESASPEHLQHVAQNLDLYLFGLFEHVIGTAGNDTILGTAADNILIGNGGDDYLDGRGGNDTLAGGEGNNTLIGGAGDDTFYISGTQAGFDRIDDTSTDDHDVLDFSAQPAGVTVDLGLPSAQAVGARTFTIVGGAGVLGATGTAFNDILTGTVGDNVLRGGAGNDVINGLDGNDTLEGGADDDTVSGGDGDDWYIEVPGSTDYRIDTSGDDTLDFSQARSAIHIDLSLDAGQLQTVDESSDGLALTGIFENVIGSGFGDYIAGNRASNKLIGGGGQDTISGGDGDDYIQGGFTQVVFLDFDSATQSFEWQYDSSQRAAILARLQSAYAPFGVQFTLSREEAASLSAPTGGVYATIIFNDGAPGGSSDQIDFRNLNPGGTSRVNVTTLLGGTNPPLTRDNVTALSGTIAAHELGHLMGLRHSDSFGWIGSGSYLFDGAPETPRHLMASPDSVGVTVADGLNNPYFGEREAIKLAMATTGAVISESLAAHSSIGAAMSLGTLMGLTVPNTLSVGDHYYATDGHQNTFQVAAQDITGTIGAAGERDYYSFTAIAGQTFTFEVFSAALTRLGANRFDSLLRLYDAAGNLLATSDNDFESLDAMLLDWTSPAAGTYFIEVSAAGDQTGRYELLGYTFAIGDDIGHGDTLIGSKGRDTLIGSGGDDEYIMPDGSDDNTVRGGATSHVLDLALTVAEGSPVAFQAQVPDPDSTTTYSVVGTLPTGALFDATTGRFEWLSPDSGVFSVHIVARSASGLTADTTVSITVTNVAPTATGISGPATLGVSQSGTFTLTGVTDPSSSDSAALRYSFATSANGLAADYAHASNTNAYVVSFATAQSVTIFARVYDPDGGVSATFTYSVVVGQVFTSGGDLYVYGTAADDNIQVTKSSSGFAVKINGRSQGTFTATGTIRVFAGAGDDIVCVDSAITRPVVLLGQAGNDILTGGSGNDTLEGGDGCDTLDSGAGNDTVSGGDGNDVFIGGSGADNLDGGNGDDVFLGWETDFLYDTLQGGAGNDRITNSDWWCSFLPSALVLSHFDPSQSIEEISNYSWLSCQWILGTDGNDFLDFSRTRLVGITGADARGGNDTVVASDLTIGFSYTGGSGDDILVSGNQIDILSGGGGNDVFRYKLEPSIFGNTIVGFQKGRDLIDLSALGVKRFGSPPSGGGAWVSAARWGNDTIVTIHFPDGSVMTVYLSGFTGTLSASDFVFAS